MLSLRRWQTWAFSALGWTTYALFNSAGSYAIVRSAGEKPVFSLVFGWNFSFAGCWLLVTPFIYELASRFGFSRKSWGKPLGIHIMACLAITVIVSWYFILWNTLLGWADSSTPFRLRLLSLGLTNLPVCLATMGLAHAVVYHAKYRERLMESSRLEASLAQAQLEILRSKMEPHFLFNALNSIATLTRKDPGAAERMTLQLATLLRVLLDCGDAQEISLKQELELLANYVAIQQTRFCDRLTVRVNVDAELLSAPVPSLILQPLVENAIRHGIAKSAAPGWVEIVAAKHNGTIRIEIADNGVGFVRAPGDKDLGFGLRNTQARLKQLYGARSELVLENMPEGGCRVSLGIPLPENWMAAAR